MGAPTYKRAYSIHTMRPPLRTRTVLLDRIGVWMSGLCMVHCLLFPVLLAALPMLPAGEALHSWLHPVFALILLPVTWLAAAAGLRRHGDRRVAVVLGVGVVLICAAAVLAFRMPEHAVETGVTLAGSLLLIAGHLANWRLLTARRMQTA